MESILATAWDKRLADPYDVIVNSAALRIIPTFA